MSCCYGCTKRYVGCHANCDDYRQFMIENENLKKQRNLDRIARSMEVARWLAATAVQMERRRVGLLTK